jgi:hypothetical protein
MQLAPIFTRKPSLVQALEALSQRDNPDELAHSLCHELSGITVLVARKFTNDKTADGLLEAFYLTVGCISMAINQAGIADVNESKLTFLLHHGAEYVFQMGFRHIKALAALPYDTFVSDFDNDPFIQQRNIKVLFCEICRADPEESWSGSELYNRELQDRKRNQAIVELAKWLRKKHFAGPVKDPDLDANAVIAISIIFAIMGDARIVARTGQKEIEKLIHRAREYGVDIDSGWNTLIESVPLEFHPLLRERMDKYRNTIVKKILSKARIKSVITEIQDYYAGNELEIDYP